MEFVTSTGTIYRLHNGRVRRESDAFAQVPYDILDWPCVRLDGRVKVGECVRMYVYGRGWLYTTPVREIVG